MTKKTGLASAVQKPVNPDEWVKTKPKTSTTEKPARLVVDIPADLHRRLKGKCGLEGLKIKDVIQELLEQYVSGNIQLISQ
jgi:hypothetical protein